MDDSKEQYYDVPESSPDFVKEIRKKPYLTPKEVPLDVNFTPFNHFTVTVPNTSTGIYLEPEIAKPLPLEAPSFKETASAQFKHVNDTWHYLHAGFTQLEKPWFEPPDPNFNVMDHEDQFINIKSEYVPYLLDSENERDMNFRLKRIYREQKLQDDIANGSWIPYLMGGGLGLVTDLTNLIPIATWTKYAKYGQTFLKSFARATPGALSYGAVSSLGEQLDSINGNVHDWLVDTMTRSVFAASLFGGLGVVSLSADKSALWGLREFANDYIKGVGFKLKVNNKNKVEGIEAYDMTGGSVSADKVKLAQDRADATMLKAGVFRLPYIGTAAEKFLGNRLFGSPMVNILNSKYKMLRYIGDLAVDHGIITEGLAKGKANPDKFFTKMNQTHSEISAMENQINALHMERNGFKIDNYVAQSATKAALYTRDKASEFLGKNIGDKVYISREQFFSEVEEVLHSTIPSEHGAVNEAASIFKNSMDKHYKDFRIAHNLPEDWMPPRTAQGYLMRVYDTNFLNNNERLWVDVISNYLKESDEVITKRLSPITDVENQITKLVEEKQRLTDTANISDATHKKISDDIDALKIKKRVLEEQLQNDIRTDPNLQLLAEDWNALSANEAKELSALLKRRDIVQKEIDKQKELIAGIKKQSAQREAASVKAKTAQTAKKSKRKAETGKLVLPREEQHLDELLKELYDEQTKLQTLAFEGKVNRRFYTKSKDSELFVYRNPNERLKLRDTYHAHEGEILSEELAHKRRAEHAQAYYHTIMNQTSEDTINQIMSRFTGNGAENHLKARTLLVPDELLYKHNFMSKNLMSKVANYNTWLARRTHLKNVYSESNLHEGFEPLLIELDKEFKQNRELLNNRKAELQEKLKEEGLKDKEKKLLEKQLKKVELDLANETKSFNNAKKDVNFIYEKMMGISKLTKGQRAFEASIKSATVALNLGFLPYTMITDLSANGLKHGIMPFLRDGIYPLVQSLGGLLKTKDSEAFRHGAAAINLALQHMGAGTAERNMSLQTNPYLNMGKIPSALDKIANWASNLSGANFIDNMLQRITSSVAQSEIVRIMHAYKANKGKISKRDMLWLNRYGLDPEKWADRVVSAFKKDGGGKTKVGGYQSNFWMWKDIEAANKVGDATFRATKDTIISANALDAPFWTDSNGAMGVMGPIIKGFNGWAFASLNRYMVPFMQKPDMSQFVGVMGMLAAGALVSPMRRMARGEAPYPEGMTDTQWAYEVFSDSSFFSYFSFVMNEANLLSGGTLLRDLKNDKYRDRARTGFLGPAWSDFNRMSNFFSALASNEMNEADALQMGRMVPFMNSSWTWGMSSALIKSFGLPKNREMAHRQKG